MAKVILGPMLDHVLTRANLHGRQWNQAMQGIAANDSYEIQRILDRVSSAVRNPRLAMAGAYIAKYPNYVLLARVGETWIIEHGRPGDDTVHHHVHVGMLPETTLVPLRGKDLTSVVELGPETSGFWSADTKLDYVGNLMRRYMFVDNIYVRNFAQGLDDTQFIEEHWMMFDVSKKSNKYFIQDGRFR